MFPARALPRNKTQRATTQRSPAAAAAAAAASFDLVILLNITLFC
jgi:hypothetical protein